MIPTAKRLHRGRPHSEGYWPGYVDALTNIVLNLLFLVAILAAGVFSLGMEASRRALQTVQMPEETAPAPVGNRGKSAVLQDVAARSAELPAVAGQAPAVGAVISIDAGMGDESRAKRESEVWIADVREQGERVLMSIRFRGDVVRVSDADRTQLLAGLRARHEPQPEGSIAVWAVSDADTANRRASYMRIMAVRDQLAAAGIDVSRVVTRIISGASAVKQGQLVYVLFNTTGNENAGNKQ